MKKFYVFSCVLAAVLSFFLLDFEALRGKEYIDLDAAECVNVNSTDNLIKKYGFIILEWEYEDTNTSDSYKASLYLSGPADNRTFVCNMNDGSIYALKDKTLRVLTRHTGKDAQGNDIDSFTSKTTILTDEDYRNFIEVNSLNNPLITLEEDGITHRAFLKEDYHNLVTDYPIPCGRVNIKLNGAKPEIGKDLNAILTPDSGYFLPDKLLIFCNYKDSNGKIKNRSITGAHEITFGALIKSWIFKENYYSENGYTYDNLTGEITIDGEQINGEIDIRASANPFLKFTCRYYGFTNGHIRKSYIIDDETNEIKTVTIKYYERTDNGTEKNKCKIGNAYVINDTYFIFKDEFKEHFPELFESLDSEMRTYKKAENTFNYSN